MPIKEKMFTKLGRELVVASRASGGDVNNFRLKIAIENAKAENVPNEKYPTGNS